MKIREIKIIIANLFNDANEAREVFETTSFYQSVVEKMPKGTNKFSYVSGAFEQWLMTPFEIKTFFDDVKSTQGERRPGSENAAAVFVPQD